MALAIDCSVLSVALFFRLFRWLLLLIPAPMSRHRLAIVGTLVLLLLFNVVFGASMRKSTPRMACVAVANRYFGHCIHMMQVRQSPTC
jgi:hypothetical protein